MSSGPDNLQCVAAGSIVFNAGVPAWVWQYGFGATVTDTAPGTVGLVLGSGLQPGGVDATACAIICTARTTLVASNLVSFGVAHTSDTVKVITILNEGAAGAVSALADVNFDIVVFQVNNMAA